MYISLRERPEINKSLSEWIRDICKISRKHIDENWDFIYITIRGHTIGFFRPIEENIKKIEHAASLFANKDTCCGGYCDAPFWDRFLNLLESQFIGPWSRQILHVGSLIAKYMVLPG